MNAILRPGLLCIAATVLIGCAGNADRPPTPKTASFDMRPMPKRTSGTWANIVDAPVSAFRVLTGNAPIRYVRMMEDPDFPDERRKGITTLASRSFGQREPYIRRYRQIAQSDPDYLVRAAAIRALNASRDREAVPVFIAALKDQNDRVRLQAAKALSNIPDPSASEPLTRVLGNQAESKDVRIAASEALRHYRNIEVARVLAGTLHGRDFGIAWQSRWSLKILTGRDYHYDEQEWLNYLTGADKPLG
jgi:hypothetical protein